MFGIKSFPLAVAVAALCSASQPVFGQAPNGSGAGGYAALARQAESRRIALGSTMEGSLSASDPVFRDSSHFQVWRFSARAGQDVVIALESADFEPYMMLVDASGQTERPLRSASPDSVSKSARMAMRILTDGDYLIVANTQEARDTGRYRVSLATVAQTCAAGGPCSVESETTDGLTPINRIRVDAAPPIALGGSRSGELAPGDGRLRDSSYFDAWRFDGRAGERIVIEQMSSELDTYLILARQTPAGPESVAENDDASGSNARIAFELQETGTYVIVATSYAQDTGRYNISLRSMADACAAGGPCELAPPAGQPFFASVQAATPRTIALGDTVMGRLGQRSLTLGDGTFFDAYRFIGSANEEVAVFLSARGPDADSTDTYLHLLRREGDSLVRVAADDDGGGGTNSLVTARLPQSGEYVLVANGLAASDTGNYALALLRIADACASRGVCAVGSDLRSSETGERRRLPLFATVPGAPRRAIIVGDSASERLAAGDRTLGDGTFFDAYSFRAEAGDEVAIFLSSQEFDAFLHVVRVENDSVVDIRSNDDGGGGRNSLVTALLPQTGEYVIVANGLTATDTGSYTLNVMHIPEACATRRACAVGADLSQLAAGDAILAAPAQRISLGAPITGRLEADAAKLPDGKPFQPWRFSAGARDSVVITNSSSDFDAYLYLYRVDGGTVRQIATDDDGGGSLDAQLSLELAEAGDYLVVAGSFSASATGQYRLHVESMAVACAAGGPCAPGETSAVTGRIRPALAAAHVLLPSLDTIRGELAPTAPRLEGRGRFQSYRFTGRANDRIVITMEAERFDPYLHLALINPPSLRVVESDDDGGAGTNSRLVATLPASGEYLVVASALTGDDTTGFGPYSIRMAPCDSACAAFSETVAARSEASYQRALGAQRRRIPIEGLVEAELGASDPALSDGARFHAYWIQATAGRTLRAALQSAQFDPYLVLLRVENDSLVLVTSDDDGGEGLNALLEWPVDRSGAYVLVTTAYAQASLGRYVLNVEQAAESAREAFLATIATTAARSQLRQALAARHLPLALGQTVTGQMTDSTPQLEGRGRFQTYRFTGRTNERVVVTLESDGFDPYLYLALVNDQTLRIIGTDDDGGNGVGSRLVATLPTSGEYLVVATAFGAADSAGISPYTIKLALCDDNCASTQPRGGDGPDGWAQDAARAPRRPLPLGTAIQAQLTSTDPTLGDGSHFHAYALEATAGANLRASMESSAFDPWVVLYRVAGDSLVRVAMDDDGGEGTNALLTWRVDQSGSYVLVANSIASAATGAYTLHVTLAPRTSH